ncbi:hypothetical protein KM043_009564 [Ampulex compressa]|nr:hypothetical protein KM043_009564 [Ampulex compressa]
MTNAAQREFFQGPPFRCRKRGRERVSEQGKKSGRAVEETTSNDTHPLDGKARRDSTPKETRRSVESRDLPFNPDIQEVGGPWWRYPEEDRRETRDHTVATAVGRLGPSARP